MRRRYATVLAVMLAAIAAPAWALERTSFRTSDFPEKNTWKSSTTTSIVYYNTCTDWVHGFSQWRTGESIGVWFDVPDNPGGPCVPALVRSWHATDFGVPSGYGYTGTIQVHGGQTCDDPVLAQQPWLPPPPPVPGQGAWHSVEWGGLSVTDPFLVRVIWATGHPSGLPSTVEYLSDHPAAGPTGPPASGFCYPADRTVHSLYFGTPGGSNDFCPNGVHVTDSVGAVEWLLDVEVRCPLPSDVEEASWGGIKVLYR